LKNDKNIHIKSVPQTYGIPTYDALFKYVMSEDSVRPSFINSFVPGIVIKSSKRLDEHMNPLQELQLLRTFIHREDTDKTVKRISSTAGACLGFCDSNTSVIVEDSDATKFLHEFIGHFNDMKKAFPRIKYDGTMDFVCALDSGEYALVEIQVAPQDHWDRRALAYIAAFYGNQLRQGDKWGKHIKKVIGINILGGGKDNVVYWKDSPGEYARHYKFQEQLHDVGANRFIDGIELFQYSIMNAPDKEDPASSQEKNDWITFFKRGHQMSEEQVKSQIQTPAVLEAFQRAKLSSLPGDVKDAYEDEDKQYDRYSEYTQQLVDEAVDEALLIGGARALKRLGTMTNADIAAALDNKLTEAEVAAVVV
jgi:predicted transposase/invertase (TIGR01784 family)